MPEDDLKQYFRDHARIFESMLSDKNSLFTLNSMAQVLIDMYTENIRERKRRRLVVFGNGGSLEHSDNLAQHLTAELTVRFQRPRRSLDALALTSSVALTAAANDFGLDQMFARLIEGTVCRYDVVLGITISGTSRNVLYGLKKAQELGAITMAFTSCNGLARLEDLRRRNPVDYCYKVPLDPTQKENIGPIQVAHLAAVHYLCDRVDKAVADLEEELRNEYAQ